MKKFIYFCLLCSLIFVTTSINAQEIDRGSIGNLTWTLEKISGDVTLTISGQGAMPSPANRDCRPSFWPWHTYRTSIKIVNIGNGVTSIGCEAFSGFTSLTSVTIPNTVTSIGFSAFRGTSALHSIDIPNSVRSIGWFAFSHSGLTSVVIPNRITIIESDVFANTALTSVTIPNSVTTIKTRAFYRTSLTSITIPRSVTSIEFNAFGGDLVSITILNTRPPTMDSRGGFSSPHHTNRNRFLFVPQEALLLYQLNDTWTRQFPIILAVEQKQEYLARVGEQPLQGDGYCNRSPPGWGNILGTVSFVSDQTWTIGGQTWSDAVTATACQKTIFSGGSAGSFNADCRSNSDFPGDLFSWCAVRRFADVLCPYPWRVPTRQNFIDLDVAMGGNGQNRSRNTAGDIVRTQTAWYTDYWGGAFGGKSHAQGIISDRGWGYYWSLSEHNANSGFHLSYSRIGVINPRGQTNKGFGLRLRCVR